MVYWYLWYRYWRGWICDYDDRTVPRPNHVNVQHVEGERGDHLHRTKWHSPSHEMCLQGRFNHFASGHLIQHLIKPFNILSGPTISHPCICTSYPSYHVVASTHLPSNIIQANCCPSSDGYPSRVVSKVILSNLVVLSSSGSSIPLFFLSPVTN